jgi:hypothetical protein
MAGYSGTPLPKKLGIRAGDRLLLLEAPEHLAALLGALPQGVTISAGLVDNKVCAIDETWSGLRCVIRRENRPSAR